MTSVTTFVQSISSKVTEFMSGSKQVSNRDLALWTLGAVFLGYLLKEGISDYVEERDSETGPERSEP